MSSWYFNRLLESHFASRICPDGASCHNVAVSRCFLSFGVCSKIYHADGKKPPVLWPKSLLGNPDGILWLDLFWREFRFELSPNCRSHKRKKEKLNLHPPSDEWIIEYRFQGASEKEENERPWEWAWASLCSLFIVLFNLISLSFVKELRLVDVGCCSSSGWATTCRGRLF